MAPSIILKELCEQRRLRVLDPMSGSGTVVAMAARAGHTAIGVDVDPLSVLLASVWASDISSADVRKCAREALNKAQAICRTLSAKDAFLTTDDETAKFIKYWFDLPNRRQLGALALAIRNQSDPLMQRALWCAFSRMIIAKTATVSLAADIPHSRPHRVRDRAEYRAFSRFPDCIDGMLRVFEKSAHGGGVAQVSVGDARKLAVEANSIDLIITSPPYLNAIDYMRTSRFSLVWMGYTIPALRAIRAKSIGTEIGLREKSQEIDQVVELMTNSQMLPPPEHSMVRRFVVDMDDAISESARVLNSGGRATYVVGNSTLRGIFVKNSDCVTHLARKNGLSVVSRYTRKLPDNLRYLPPPSKRDLGFQARMRTEVIVRLAKS